MAQLNEFMTRIDLSVLNDYVAANGKSVVYAKGERIVQQGCLCRYVGIVQSGYFKYVALNSKGQEVVTGFSFEGEVVTDYVQGFLYDQPSLTSIVAGCDAEVRRLSVVDARRFIIERNPGFVAEVSSNLLQEAYCRYLNVLVKTPTERFQELVSRYLGVMHNLPIQEIASYLGISRRQLHRIREAESAADASESEDV
ncbi:Crp/Fnr family transcriptional regulator [Muribaculum intestinale]|uniref:Crp/Fnr family transcriptional regulator n=1 Tax=Muribaculum intestinale TaxID=1796646 RepID=UPI0026F393B0|nr:Crp/Fnr family transcriptional regulator [Muribaculum intestinale]